MVQLWAQSKKGSPQLDERSTRQNCGFLLCSFLSVVVQAMEHSAIVKVANTTVTRLVGDRLGMSFLT